MTASYETMTASRQRVRALRPGPRVPLLAGGQWHQNRQVRDYLGNACYEAMESECIPNTTQDSNDGAYNNEFATVTHDEGTTRMVLGRQPVPPSPGMVRDPSASLETSIGPLSQELRGNSTSRVISALRDSPEQG